MRGRNLARRVALGVATAAMISASMIGAGPAGASSDEEGAAPMPPVGEKQLIGKTFISEEITGPKLRTGTWFRVNFMRTRATYKFGKRPLKGRLFDASAGCNSLSGLFRVKKGQIRVPLAFQTLVLCQGIDDVENEYFPFIGSGTRLYYRDGILEMRRGGKSIRLTELKPPPDQPSLRGTSWRLGSTVGPAGTIAGPGPKGKVPKLSFTGSEYRIKSPCTKGSGPAAIGDGIMIFDAYRMSWGFCRGKDRKREFRQRLGGLHGVINYSLEPDGSLVFGFDETELVFTRIK